MILKEKKKEMKVESLLCGLKKGRERVKMGVKWADLFNADVGRPQHYFVLLERLLHVNEALVATSSEQ